MSGRTLPCCDDPLCPNCRGQGNVWALDEIRARALRYAYNLIAREIAVGDELDLNGARWRVTQTIGSPVRYAYAGPVDPRIDDVHYDRAIHDLNAWRREYARQHNAH
jgi:hypothetical protein